MILSIETSTDVCSVAFENKAGELFEKRVESRGSHSEKLFLFIKELMEVHQFSIDDLKAVLVSEGPGSYTGLRIAASGVKGLLFGTHVPLYSVSTLASFAFAALENEPDALTIHGIIDARRKHVYHQSFKVKKREIVATNKVETVLITSLEKSVQAGHVIIGTGLDRLDQTMLQKVKCYRLDWITARSLIALFHRDEAQSFIERSDPAEFDPRYYTSQV